MGTQTPSLSRRTATGRPGRSRPSGLRFSGLRFPGLRFSGLRLSPGSPARPEYRWLLPAGLAADPDDDRPPRRTTRDWLIDTLCFVLSLGFAVAVSEDLLSRRLLLVPEYAGSPRWLVWLDLLLGVAGSVALWWRRRWPTQIALVLILLSTFSVAGAISTMIASFTVVVHRRFQITAALTLLTTATSAVAYLSRPHLAMGFWKAWAWSLALTVIVLLWGMVVRSRRQLVVSLRDRAQRAEAEQHLRVERARSLERTRIAREMHDVLAHRISLLSLHAGALEIRPDAPADEIAGAAGVIRASAHQALQDLREVIGVLREDRPGGTAPERPQPTLADLPTLAGESRAAGMTVRLDVATGDDPVPDLTGRTAYRIVQEGLTNARKHAPGTTVTVEVGGVPGDGLTVEVRNPRPVADGGRGPGIPGAGTGLVGLAERATLAGGRLSHGRTSTGDFVLTAWLPWPAA